MLHTYYREYSANFELALREIETLLRENAAFRSYYKVRF